MALSRLPKGRRSSAQRKGNKERRDRVERRSGAERRAAGRRDGRRRSIRDHYRNDLDRHFWTWASPSARKRRRQERERRRRRKTALGLIASAAGALGAAGLSVFLYRKLREEDERPIDPAHAQADLDEADFGD